MIALKLLVILLAHLLAAIWNGVAARGHPQAAALAQLVADNDAMEASAGVRRTLAFERPRLRYEPIEMPVVQNVRDPFPVKRREGTTDPRHDVDRARLAQMRWQVRLFGMVWLHPWYRDLPTFARFPAGGDVPAAIAAENARRANLLAGWLRGLPPVWP